MRKREQQINRERKREKEKKREKETAQEPSNASRVIRKHGIIADGKLLATPNIALLIQTPVLTK